MASYQTFFQRFGLWIGLLLIFCVASFLSWAHQSMILERLEVELFSHFSKIQKYESKKFLPSKLQFVGPDGRQIKLRDFRGKYLVLNLWATWCTPCVKELPELKLLKEHYKGGKWNVVAVSIDSVADLEKITSFSRKLDIGDVALYHDVFASFQKELPTKSLPVTYIINSRGRILYEISGPGLWSSPEIIKFLDQVTAVY